MKTTPVSWVADEYQATLIACGETEDFLWRVGGNKRWIILACD